MKQLLMIYPITPDLNACLCARKVLKKEASNAY